MAKERPKMQRSKDVLAALRLRYPGNAYAMVCEVANSTGGPAARSADCVLMSLWPSRGLEIIGVEVKVSRSDWVRELQDPAKADPIFKYCDKWFVAVGDESIVKDGELPPTWGLLIPRSATELRCKVEAPLQQRDKAIPRPFLAALLRRIVEQVTPEAEISRAFTDGKEAGRKLGIESNAYEVQTLKDFQKRVREFERESGINITENWRHPKDVGEAVRLVLAGTHNQQRDNLRRLRKSALEIATRIDQELGEENNGTNHTT